MKKAIKILTLIALITITGKIKAAQYIWPIDEKNSEETYIEYGYGRRDYNSLSYDKKYNYAPYEGYYVRNESHFGVDITGIKGNTYDVVSVIDGKVISTSLDQFLKPGINYVDRNQRKLTTDGGGYGNYIVIQDEKTGLCFLYAHLKAGSITLKNGDTVKIGQKIGVMGSSGDSGHMHLHFEVRPNIASVFPLYKYNVYKSLVPTTTYGKETLNPVEYIGEKPEKKIKKQEEKQETKKENTEIEKHNSQPEPTEFKYEPVDPYVPQVRATIKGIHHNESNGTVSVNIEFDKEINVITAPTLEVKIGNETKNARFATSNLTSITYIFEYSQFDITTRGEIFIDLVGGKITTLGNDSLEANTDFGSNNIGSMKAYSVRNINMSLQGDVNNDGKITAVDASLAQRLYVKIIEGKTLTKEDKEMIKRADMDGNGRLNAVDASMILKKYSDLSAGKTSDDLLIICDFNNDNNITMDDYEMLQNAVNSNYQERYDINNDNRIDQNDINIFKTVLKKYGSR